MNDRSHKKYISAVIVAAGRGRRMNMDINKQYLPLDGIPVLARTLLKFQNCQSIDEIILVVNEDEKDYCLENIVKPYELDKITQLANGGAERQESVYNGIMAVSDCSDIVVIHDGARPFVTEEIIMDSIHTAIEVGGGCVGVPTKDTVKKVHIDGIIIQTLPRSCLWIVQTPQTFRYGTIKKAHEKARQDRYTVTDDAMVAEYSGYKVKMVMGSYKNIKITTQEDLNIGLSFLSEMDE